MGSLFFCTGLAKLRAAIGATETRDAYDEWTPPFQLARNLCLFAAHAAGVPAMPLVRGRDLKDIFRLVHRGDPEELPAAFDNLVAKMAGFQTNRYQHTPADNAKIARHWGSVGTRFGYGLEDAA